MRLLALLLWFAALLPLHLLSKLAARRSPWPRRFLAGAAWLAGARVTVQGEQVRGPVLLVANHLSWLDILVLGGATGCAFVSKDQLGHGLIHWLADQNRTLYVNRNARRDIGAQTRSIAAALERGEVVAFFPEGTVGPGDALLPFRPPLFAAVDGAGWPARPVAIDYGEAAGAISWFGEDGAANFKRVLGRRGTLPVVVRLLDPLPPGDRKAMAASAQESIAAALGFKSGGHSPIATRQ